MSEFPSRVGKQKSFYDFPCPKNMGPGQSKKYAVIAGCHKTAGSLVELGKWREDTADLASAGRG